MRLSVDHRTRYIYSRPVHIEPHTFRFCPRSDGAQRLLSFEIDIEPRPRLTAQCLDAEGNTVTQAWFEGQADVLAVRAAFTVETERENPYDFLLTEPTVASLPARYDRSAARLEFYRRDADVAAPVREFAATIAAESDNETMRFLPRLSRKIYDICEFESRPVGGPSEPAATLAERKGACRDLAMLYIAACRSMGLAARFVSGYQGGDEEWERHEMHAWAEVYLPGGGWRGFDPSHGVAAADSLVVVAAAADPALASPVAGSIRGTGATQRMEFALSIEG